MTAVLVVDDSAVDRRIARGLLGVDSQWTVSEAEHGIAALASMKQAAPDLVVTDLQMPEMEINDAFYDEIVESKKEPIDITGMTAPAPSAESGYAALGAPMGGEPEAPGEEGDPQAGFPRRLACGLTHRVGVGVGVAVGLVIAVLILINVVIFGCVILLLAGKVAPF